MLLPNRRQGLWLMIGLVLAAALANPAARAATHSEDSSSLGFLFRTNYHGWADSIWVGNGRVEAIIVPQIGRVMQFRLAGHKDGPFWENPGLAGKPADAKAGAWQNFGGDKVWPAPQKMWGELTPTNWPPPAGFDQAQWEARINGWVVTLVSPPDPFYGIRVSRTIELQPGKPAMHIETVFEKVQGRTLDVSIWCLTQLKEPLFTCTRVDPDSRYPQGFQQMSDRRPPSLKLERGLLTLERNPKLDHKIGLDVGSLIWMGPDYVLRIDSPRHQFDPYPDEGTSAAIATSADPLDYVEYSMLGPVIQMRVGHKIGRASTYSLLPRTEVDPRLEMRKLLPQ